MEFLKYLFHKALKKIRMAGVRSSFVHPTSKLESGTYFVSSSIDKHSYCGYDCEIYLTLIGSYTSIANGVVLGGASHPTKHISMSPAFYKGHDSIKKKFIEFEREQDRKVEIGNDVSIGRSAIVLPGVRVGDGAVIGAGAIVTKDVPPYAIFAGNPAKLIRFRFNRDQINFLCRIKWWEFEEEFIDKIAFMMNDIDKFCEKITDYRSDIIFGEKIEN